MLRRRVLGIAVGAARIIGVVLIILAILSLPQLQFLTGHMAMGFQILSSLALGLVGIVWLVGVKLFLRFFDQFLSRN